MRSTAEIKTPHTLNSKGESWKRVSGTVARGGRLKGLQNEFVTQKNFDFQLSTNFKLMIEIKGISMGNPNFFFKFIISLKRYH